MVYQFNLSYRQIKRNVIQRVSPLCCRRESVFPMRIFLKGAVNGTNRTHSTFIGVRTPPCNHHAHKGTFSKELVKAAPRRLEDSDNVLRPPDVCSLCIHACACEEFFLPLFSVSTPNLFYPHPQLRTPLSSPSPGGCVLRARARRGRFPRHWLL